MTDLPPSRRIIRHGQWQGAHDLVTLTYDARFLRRRRLVTAHDKGFLVDLGETVSLDHGDAFELEDGRLIEVIAAEEALIEITATPGGPGLHRLAWHIGNRHTPCQIEDNRLLIRHDPVLADMLGRLGAHVHLVSEPFTPEGGAYGIGRTLGHDHGPADGTPHLHVHHHGSSHDVLDDDTLARGPFGEDADGSGAE